MNESINNKTLYKLFLIIIKFLPNVLALIQIISLLLHSIGINSFGLTCIGGTSLSFLLLLYFISYIFKFCGIHRLSLHYITTITITSILSVWFNINISRIYPIITGIFILSWIIYWYKNKNNKKVNDIKLQCDKCIDCGF